MAADRRAAAQSEAAVQAEMRQGGEAMHGGDLAGAEQHFRRAVQLAPRIADTHLDLGLLLAREGKLTDALASLDTAVKLQPGIAGGHLFRGIVLHQLNRDAEARVALQKAANAEPKNTEPLVWLATVESADGHPDAAAAWLDKAVQLAPDDEDILEARGRAHSTVAQQSYSRLARINPDSWHVHRVRSELLASEGKHAEAAAELEQAVRSAPQNGDLWEALGDQYRAANQMDDAQRAYTRQMQLSPGNPLALYDLGSVDVERGDYAAGVPLLRTMLQSYTGAPVAEYYLGRGLAAQGESAEAATWLEKAAQHGNGGEITKRSYFELARLYRKSGDTARSQAALAEYNRIREAADRASAKQVEDWRKLGAKEPATGAAVQ